MRVVQLNVDTSVETDAVLNSDYTVSLNPDQESTPGGTVTYLVAPTVDTKVTLIGSLSYEQPADLPDGGAFRAQQVEDALDRLAILAQQIQEQVDRCAKVPVSAGDAADLNEAIAVLSANIAGLQTIVANIGAVISVADVSADVTTLAPIAADITTVAAISPAVPVVAAIDAEVVAVAAIDDDVVTVAGIAPEVQIVADAFVSGSSSLLGFQQAGVGAVMRPLESKAREQISVLDFGAVGNGVANDTAAIQLSLDYASLTGKTVYFPAGSYVISTSLVVTGNNVRVLLDHNASILHNTPDFMALRISGDNCTVEGGLGGGFIGPAAWDPGTGATTPTYGVIWVTGQNFTALNTRLFNIRRIGIGVKDVNNATVQGCVIDGNQPSPVFPLTTTFHFGVLFDPGTEASFGNFRAQDCRIKACTTGVFIGNYGVGQTAQAVVVSGCLFDGMWDHGVYSNYTSGMVLSGCAFNRCHVGVAASGRGNVITNNTHYTEKTAGLDPRDVAAAVSLRDPEQCIVSNISIRGNGDTVAGQTVIGIDLTNVTAVAMNNNIVENISMFVATGKAQAVRIVASTTHSGNVIRNVSYYGAVRDSLGVIEVGGSAGIQCQISGITARILGGVGVRVVSAVSLTQAQISDINVWVDYSAPGAETWFVVLLVSCVGVVVRDLVASAASGLGANITLRGLTEGTAASLNELHNVKMVQIASLAAFVPAVAFSGTSLLLNIAADPVPTAGYRAGSIYRRTASGGGGVYTVQTDGGAWTLLS
ncbi:MAG: right-handed parallel beta-helix repeat-containing protein [Hydrogenophaga sp.]|nr:right-handed parallel beta-helix repeat-containing protein [Hydrogenophaga sp.]